MGQFMKKQFPESKSDLFAAFIERCTQFAEVSGFAALITMQSWMFLSSYQKLRSSLLTSQHITSMLHLGTRAFDSIGGEVVSSTAFVLSNLPAGSSASDRKRLGAFIRLVDGTSEAEKTAGLTAALRIRARDVGFYWSSSEDFVAVPGSPIAYWLSENMRTVFVSLQPLSNAALVAVGLQTGDNARFLRQWWEVSDARTNYMHTPTRVIAARNARWFPYNKGGEFRKWYGNQEYVVNWENDGHEILAFRPRSVVRNPTTYFSPAVSWSDISSGAPSFRYFPEGFVHGNKGNSIFGFPRHLKQLLGIMNSTCVTRFLDALAPTMTASVGDVAKTPIPRRLVELSVSAIEALETTSKVDWETAETAWGFDYNPLVTTARVPRN